MTINSPDKVWVSRHTTVRHEDYSRCANWPVIYIRRLTEHPDDRSLRLTPALHSMEFIFQVYPADAINEHRELIAKGMVESHFTEEGIAYSETPKTWSKFPDGLATINGVWFNLEVTSITPRTTSGKTIPEYMRLMGAQHISEPILAPVRHCVTSPCQPRTYIAPEPWTVSNKHPADHTYFEVWPAPIAAEFFPIIEAGKYPMEVPYIVTSQIHHTRSMFVSQFKAALERKRKVVQGQGKGRNNCVIILSEGIVPEPEWFHNIAPSEFDAFDAVILVALNGYVGMMHNLNWAKQTLTVVLKCGFCGKKDCRHAPTFGSCAEFMEGLEVPESVKSTSTRSEAIYEMNQLRYGDFYP